MRVLLQRRVPVLPVMALLIAMTSVQSGASVAKMLFSIAGPVGTVALRIGFGTIILCAFGRPWRARVRRESWLALVVYGSSLGTMNFCFYQALDRLPIGVAVAVSFAGPLTVGVISSKRLSDFTWIAIAAGGIALLMPGETSRADLTGLLFAVGAGACWGLYIVFGQIVGKELGIQCVALGSLIAAILIVPIGLFIAPPSLFSRAVLLPAVTVAVLSTALPYSLEMFSLTRLPRRTFSVLTSLEPAVGALSGLVFLGERLVPLQWTAILLVMIASTGAACSGGEPVPVSVPLPD